MARHSPNGRERADPKGVLRLRRHAVGLSEHRAEWAVLFAEEAARLRQVVGDLVEDIQHVGSTAVEGLPAKPILDIVVALRTAEDVPALTERLCASGYIYRDDSGADGGHLFVLAPQPDVRTVHLHAVLSSDPQWRDYLAFRELLRSDSDARVRYARLKRRLAEKFTGDRLAYTTGKESFIRGLLREVTRTP
jgi:GrpB-like predicted nucleotidyltransferase (UPF0157 family)